MNIIKYINENYKWIDIDEEKPDLGRSIIFSDEYNNVGYGEFHDKWEDVIDMSPFGEYDYPFDTYDGNVSIMRIRYWMYEPDYWKHTPNV